MLEPKEVAKLGQTCHKFESLLFEAPRLWKSAIARSCPFKLNSFFAMYFSPLTPSREVPDAPP